MGHDVRAHLDHPVAPDGEGSGVPEPPRAEIEHLGTLRNPVAGEA